MSDYIPEYEGLSQELCLRIENEMKMGTFPNYAFKNENVLRRDREKDRGTLLRPPFVRDVEKILHCPYYNRYADKTQVFSFRKNDDLTRRAQHVQLVSRIARNIGRLLNLNLDLIEAIALGHDIGHTPFGHSGERLLDGILYEKCGRHFCHNLQSVRVLDRVFPYNISLQTLDGIACHDGELELDHYEPKKRLTFEEFDEMIEECALDKSKIKSLVPSTLEGCVVRISDIIAYLGKDRQDAERLGLVLSDRFEDCAIGRLNAEIINNLTVNIVENSYGKSYIKMDERHFEALKKAKNDNYQLIYKDTSVTGDYEKQIGSMMAEMFDRLLDDLREGKSDSPIFTHHVAYLTGINYSRKTPYERTDPPVLVADYISGMTDDYFIDLYDHLFPDSGKRINYVGYFE